MHKVQFNNSGIGVQVKSGTTLLEAAHMAGIELNTNCGGEGICGKCIMIVISGEISDRISWPFTKKQINEGYVLACLSRVYSDLTVEIPGVILQGESSIPLPGKSESHETDREILDYTTLPVIQKIYIEFEKPTLFTGQADHQLVSEGVRSRLNIPTMQMGLKIIETLPRILRNGHYKITLTVGLRRDIAEIMNVEVGNRVDSNYMVIVDMGTTTIVAQLVNAHWRSTIDSAGCYNSQSIHGSEVTGRMIHAERKGTVILQELLVKDINKLIGRLCDRNGIALENITAVVCAGNTAMEHFLLGLETGNIRRKPFIPVTVEPPPLRAGEVGLEINRRGLLYSLPGISGWVGSDLTAGILAMQMHRKNELSLLIDIGTNGEIILGNKDWLMAASASAGPALEGASVQCGMRAEPGAIDKVYVEAGRIKIRTIDGEDPLGICGSGIMDLVSVLLNENIINRSGIFIDEKSVDINSENNEKRYYVKKDSIYITEKDLENIITAKAAIFAAVNILMKRLSISFSDLETIYIAGAFGNYLNIDSAVNIGLLPPLASDKIRFVGNTSLKGAKLAAFYQEAFYELSQIRMMTTYYDLLGAEDYVEEFRKAMFLPHTDINYWEAVS